MCKVSPAMAAGRAVKNRNSKTNQKRVIRIFQRLMFVVFYATRYPSKKFCRQLKPEGWPNLAHANNI